MKNFIFAINTLLISAFLLGGCNIPNAEQPSAINADTTGLRITQSIKEIYEKNPNGKNWVIVGDTIVRKKDVKLHTPPKQVDLGDLKKKDGTALKYVAIGSSLTAGVREGGLHQEGQLTSFPNLLARQMLITDFSQPLFGDTDFNGFGYKTLSSYSENQVPKYKAVSNNNAIRGNNGDLSLLNKYVGKNDNYGIPYILDPGFYYTTSNFGSNYHPEKNNRFLVFTERIFLDIRKKGVTVPSEKDIAKGEIYAPIYILKAKNYDLFTLETGFEDFLYYTLTGGGAKNSNGLTYFNYRFSDQTKDFLSDARIKNMKGIVLTIPDVMDFPYFNLVKTNRLQDINKSNIYDETGNVTSSTTLFLPNLAIDSLLNRDIKGNKKGLNQKNTLADEDIVTDDEIKDIKYYADFLNNNIRERARYYNYPVVDLYDIYKQIHKYNYVSRDGVKVDPTFLKGNFYSSDGIYPSAFGQAVIANEVIYMLNFYYGTKIPYIDSKVYLKK